MCLFSAERILELASEIFAPESGRTAAIVVVPLRVIIVWVQDLLTIHGGCCTGLLVGLSSCRIRKIEEQRWMDMVVCGH